MNEVGSITSATVSNIAQYVGKVVSIWTTSMTIARAKFATAADPLVVTILKMDGTPALDANNHPITRTLPLSGITAMWEYGVEQPPTTAPSTALQVQASAIPPWVVPTGVVALGILIIIWKSGILSQFGIGPKPHGRKSRRSKRRSKR